MCGMWTAHCSKLTALRPVLTSEVIGHLEEPFQKISATLYNRQGNTCVHLFKTKQTNVTNTGFVCLIQDLTKPCQSVLSQ